MHDAQHLHPSNLPTAAPQSLASMREALAARGLFGIGVPPRMGGGGGQLRDAIHAVAETARCCVAQALVLASQRLLVQALVRSENIGAAEYQLPRLLDGDIGGNCAASWPQGAELAPALARDTGRGWLMSGGFPVLPNLQHDWFVVSVPVLFQGARQFSLVLLRAEETGIAQRHAAVEDHPAEAGSALALNNVFLREDEIIAEDGAGGRGRAAAVGSKHAGGRLCGPVPPGSRGAPGPRRRAGGHRGPSGQRCPGGHERKRCCRSAGRPAQDVGVAVGCDEPGCARSPSQRAGGSIAQCGWQDNRCLSPPRCRRAVRSRSPSLFTCFQQPPGSAPHHGLGSYRLHRVQASRVRHVHVLRHQVALRPREEEVAKCAGRPAATSTAPQPAPGSARWRYRPRNRPHRLRSTGRRGQVEAWRRHPGRVRAGRRAPRTFSAGCRAGRPPGRRRRRARWCPADS